MGKTWKPMTAGILNIVSGTFFLTGGIIIVSLLNQPTMATPWAGYAMYSMGFGGTPSASFVTTFIVTLAAVLIILGIVSILGGIYSLKRSLLGLALAGTSFTFFPLPPLGIPAIILVVLSKNEFE